MRSRTRGSRNKPPTQPPRRRASDVRTSCCCLVAGQDTRATRSTAPEEPSGISNLERRSATRLFAPETLQLATPLCRASAHPRSRTSSPSCWTSSSIPSNASSSDHREHQHPSQDDARRDERDHGCDLRNHTCAWRGGRKLQESLPGRRARCEPLEERDRRLAVAAHWQGHDAGRRCSIRVDDFDHHFVQVDLRHADGGDRFDGGRALRCLGRRGRGLVGLRIRVGRSSGGVWIGSDQTRCRLSIDRGEWARVGVHT